MGKQATPASRMMIPVKGHPGIWKRGDRYVVKYTDRGQRRKKYLRTLTEAKKFRATALAGEARPTSAQSFKSYATEWVRTYRGRSAKGISDETRESYAHALTHHAIPFFGTTQLGRIDPPMLKRYVEHLENKKLSAATIRRYYAPVRALFATAYEDRLISHQLNVRVVVHNAAPAPQAEAPHRRGDQAATRRDSREARRPDAAAVNHRRQDQRAAQRYLRRNRTGPGRAAAAAVREVQDRGWAGADPSDTGDREDAHPPPRRRPRVRRRSDLPQRCREPIRPACLDSPRIQARRRACGGPVGQPTHAPPRRRDADGRTGLRGARHRRDAPSRRRGAARAKTYMHPKVRNVDFLDDLLGG